MRKLGYIQIILYFLVLTSIEAADLSYVIRPVLNSILPQIEVQMEVLTDANGQAHLLYYNSAWGETNLFNALASIKSSTAGTKTIRLPGKNMILVNGPANTKVRIEYVIRQDFQGAPSLGDYYRPIINQDYFHLFGHRLFVLPVNSFSGKGRKEIEITWDIKGEYVHHNFGDLENGVYKLNESELLESVLVGGDFRKESINIDGIELQLLTRGDWKNFDDEDLLGKIQSIVKVQRAFWDDYSDEIYTVTLLPLNSNIGREIGGTGLAKGFASYCANSDKASIENLLSLYYHEIMHHWIGGKIRNASQSSELWFSEGFTEYFSHLLMLEEGEISKKDFASKIKESQKKLKKRSAYGLPNSRLNLQGKYEKVPYLRGFLYANYLDLLLQKERNMRLKDVMHQILDESTNKDFTNEYFASLLLEILGQAEFENFEKYILKGEKIPSRLPNYSSNF